MLASIPSPEQGVWTVLGFPVRAYALCILAGIVVAVWWTNRRLLDRGALPGQALDISAWAVPFGIVGGRLYHVITSPQAYFGEGGTWWHAFFIWQGGLGIWGAVALGALGAWIGCRRAGVPFLDFADAAAPGLAVAQALGRWGNWFNNELYGSPTDLPWGLTIHAWDQGTGRALRDAAGNAVVLGTFQPTFLYESLWCLLVAGLVLLAERRRRLAAGQAFFLYVMLYTVGRLVVEAMRTDEANRILGLRLNIWTSVLVFLLGLVLYLRARRTRPQGEPDEPSPTTDGEPVSSA
ncbi:MAG TPA: prolipoprotein diacylglyceryl transferase [Dermatophilaceae bacterium]|nr:prolipoprotein diacylglyceryl transferase [Dermatophilaceae bacterium]